MTPFGVMSRLTDCKRENISKTTTRQKKTKQSSERASQPAATRSRLSLFPPPVEPISAPNTKIGVLEAHLCRVNKTSPTGTPPPAAAFPAPPPPTPNPRVNKRQESPRSPCPSPSRLPHPQLPRSRQSPRLGTGISAKNPISPAVPNN